MNPIRYRPEIDGLRALAVLAVVFFHATRAVPGGYTGVDVFFVISGFLITSLIQKDLAAGSFRLVDFWERRIRRIFPALAVVVGLVLVAGMMCLLPADLEDLAKSATAQSLLYSNFYFWSSIDYFGGPAELKPLLHTWSLAVEEQFYLGFPLLLMACRRLRRSTTFIMLAVIALSSFILSVWGTRVHPDATFYLLPARAWELLAGALVALAPPPQPSRRWLDEFASGLGLIGIGAAYFLFDETTRFPGAAALLPCGSAAVIIYCNGARQTYVGKALAQRPLVLVGLISYSLYLWHWPILVFCRYLSDDKLNVWQGITAACASFLCALLSWKFVEVPFRHRLAAHGRARVFAGALAVSSLLLAVSAVCWQTGGLPQRLSKEALDIAATPWSSPRYINEVEDVVNERLPMLGDAAGGIDHPCFLLWGDSHSMALADMLAELARQHGVVGYSACRSATAPVLGTWRPSRNKGAIEWNRAVVEFVRKRHIPNVILAARWAANVDGHPDGSTAPLIVDDQSQVITPSESKLVLERGLQRTIEELRRAGARVWIMRQVPEQRESPPRALVRAALLRVFPGPQGSSLVAHRRRQANADEVLLACQAADVQILDPSEYCFDNSGKSLIVGEGGSFYVDSHHLCPNGAERLLRRMFEPCMGEIAGCGCGRSASPSVAHHARPSSGGDSTARDRRLADRPRSDIVGR